MSDFSGESNFGGGNFAEYVARERERLRTEREQVFSQQEELQRKRDAIDREFVAIEAYQMAKTGKATRQALADRQPRARRGSRRQALLELIRQGDGLSRGEILDRMGLKGNKNGEMSVSNALTALTKSNQVRREGGKYRTAA
jgi:ATPase subunit of ABC transporter with duplicated ATPase domains